MAMQLRRAEIERMLALAGCWRKTIRLVKGAR
jgi:hypothetical protein